MIVGNGIDHDRFDAPATQHGLGVRNFRGERVPLGNPLLQWNRNVVTVRTSLGPPTVCGCPSQQLGRRIEFVFKVGAGHARRGITADGNPPGPLRIKAFTPKQQSNTFNIWLDAFQPCDGDDVAQRGLVRTFLSRVRHLSIVHFPGISSNAISSHR